MYRISNSPQLYSTVRSPQTNDDIGEYRTGMHLKTSECGAIKNCWYHSLLQSNLAELG